MPLPLITGRGWRGGALAAGPAAPAGASGYDLDDDHNIDTTPFIHWDASTLVSVNSASDGSTFSTWTSREGSDYDLVQADAAEQFTYEATSSNMNSKPVAYSSDGARHMMTATDFLSAGTVTMPVTIIMAVYALSGAPTYQSHFGGKNVSGDNVNSFKPYSPRVGKWNIYMNNGSHMMGDTYTAGAQVVAWELNPSGTTYNFVNLARTTISSTISTNNPFNYQFSLGAGNTGANDVVTNTEIAEFIIYNEILSDTEMSGSNVSGGQLHTIITYLKTKYGIS